MPYVTHFTSPAGDVLPIAAGTFYTVRVPAASAADKGNWEGSAIAGYSLRVDLEGVTEEHIVMPSGDDTLFTTCGLTVHFRDEALIFSLVQLPSTEQTLAVTVLNAYPGGEL